MSIAIIVDENFARFGQRVTENIAVQFARANICFDILPLDLLCRERLDKYNLLICSDIPRVSKAHISLLREFAAEGGNIVIAGLFGELDERLGRRRKPVDLKVNGERRLIRYKKALAKDDPFDMEKQAQPIPARILQMIRKLGNNPLTIRPGGSIVGSLLLKPNRKGLVLHVLNYSSRAVRNIHVQLNMEQFGFSPKSINLISPDGNAGKRLDFALKESTVSFVVPEADIYSLVEIK